MNDGRLARGGESVIERPDGGRWLLLLLLLPFLVPILLFGYKQDIASAILNDSETPVEVVIYLSIVVALVVAGKVYVKYRLTEEWSTRDIVVTTTLAVAIGILWVGWTWIWNLFQGIPVIGIYLDNFLNGFWMIGGVLVAYIIRKPGAALAGEMIAAITEIPLTPWGALVPIILGLLQGAGAEAVFAATRYRYFNLITLSIAGIVAHLFGMLYSFWVSGYGAFTIDVIVLLIVVRIVSGIVLVGVPAKLIGDALVPTGVLDGFAISRERQAEV